MEKNKPLPPLSLKDNALSTEVEFDSKKSILTLKGHAVPANAHIFFMPVFEWGHDLIKARPAELTINVAFQYLHTGAARQVFELIRLLKKQDMKLFINWYYEEDDEDMKQVGLDFSAALDMRFNFYNFEQLK